VPVLLLPRGGLIVKLQSLRDLLVDQLKDLYSAENQIIKALPKMAKNASAPELRQAFEEHLEQTRQQAARLEQVCTQLGEKPRGKKCQAVEGLIAEGKELMEEDVSAAVLDAGLIAAAQKVEHYEIASYGTVCTWADQLGESKIVQLLQQTLEEEKATDEKLTRLAKQKINLEAESGEEEEEAPPPRKKSRK